MKAAMLVALGYCCSSGAFLLTKATERSSGNTGSHLTMDQAKANRGPIASEAVRVLRLNEEVCPTDSASL